MSWDAEQQRLLTALGYTLYRPVAAAAIYDGSRDDRPGTDPAPARAGSPLAATPTESRLLAHLRLAAGCDASGVSLPPIDQLRRDPAGKRALWPSLRRLRRHRD